jgi:multisubunit Na+/H+ antiporter MnhF subunit
LIENKLILDILGFVLIAQTVMLAVCVRRVFIGPSQADRLQGVDTMNNIFLGMIIVLALRLNSPFFIDIALALGAFSFISTLAIARYIGQGRMF